jgi:flagellar basal body P-ring protein FlgI
MIPLEAILQQFAARPAELTAVEKQLLSEMITKAFKEERALPIYFNDHGRLTIELKESDFQFTSSLEAIIRRSMAELSIERLNMIESVLIDALKQIGNLRLKVI